MSNTAFNTNHLYLSGTFYLVEQVEHTEKTTEMKNKQTNREIISYLE
jgi:hypothetical protein